MTDFSKISRIHEFRMVLTAETNVYIKTNKIHQIFAFHCEVNTIRYFAKNVLKTYVTSLLFDEYLLPTFYTCKIYEILIILTDFKKIDLSLNIAINFSFVNFFLK